MFIVSCFSLVRQLVVICDVLFLRFGFDRSMISLLPSVLGKVLSLEFHLFYLVAFRLCYKSVRLLLLSYIWTLLPFYKTSTLQLYLDLAAFL